MQQVRLTSNGDGTGRLEIVLDGIKVIERQPGMYDVASMVETLPERLRCGDELLRPHLVVRLYCKSPKKMRHLRLMRTVRLHKLRKSHAC